MRATKRPTLNRLGSAALRAKRGSMRLADRACGTKRSLRSPRQARRPRLSLGELCACRRLADGLHAAVWVTANSRLIAAARAWISARLRSILASCFSPLASQRRARSSWIRAASSCRSTRHRPTAVSVPPVIPPPYVVPPHNVVRTGYTPAAPPTLGDVRSGLWSHLGADPNAHTPSCRSGHREDTDDDGDQLPPRIFATAGDANCDHSKHGGDGGSGCRYPQVVAAREPAGEKAGREDGQRPQWERRGQPKDREHDKEPDENRDRSKPPHPSIVGASAALVNPCDLANTVGIKAYRPSACRQTCSCRSVALSSRRSAGQSSRTRRIASRSSTASVIRSWWAARRAHGWLPRFRRPAPADGQPRASRGGDLDAGDLDHVAFGTRFAHHVKGGGSVSAAAAPRCGSPLAGA